MMYLEFFCMQKTSYEMRISDWRSYVCSSDLNGSTVEIDNPSTCEVIARVANLGKLEGELAINAASKAFTTWRARTGKDRAALLRRWFDLITANAKDLATLMTLEQGKPFQEALGEITYGASFVEWFAEQGKREIGRAHV